MPTQVAEIKRMIFLGSSSWGHPWQGLIWFLPADLVMCELLLNIKFLKKKQERDIPGGPVVKTPHFQCRGCEFNPWLEN